MSWAADTIGTVDTARGALHDIGADTHTIYYIDADEIVTADQWGRGTFRATGDGWTMGICLGTAPAGTYAALAARIDDEAE